MFIPSNIYKPLIFKDIRNEEVRKLLTSFPKESLVLVHQSVLFVFTNNAVLFEVPLKTNLGDQYFNDCAFLYNYREINDIEFTEDMILRQDVWQYMQNVISSLNIDKQFGLLAHDENVRECEEFENLLGLKADKGRKFFKLNAIELNKTYKIPMFSGFPNINKQDTVGIDIYSTSQPNIVLIDMNIYKKKFNRNIHMKYKILDI